MEARSRLRHRELSGCLKKGEVLWCHQQLGCLSVKEVSVWTSGASSPPWFKSWRKKFCYCGRAVQSLLCPCPGCRSSSSLPGSHPAHALFLCWGETWPGINPHNSLISRGSKSPKGAALCSSPALHMDNRESRTAGSWSTTAAPQSRHNLYLPRRQISQGRKQCPNTAQRNWASPRHGPGWTEGRGASYPR